MTTTTPSMSSDESAIGLSGLAVYMPPFRVQLQDWCEWTNNPWSKIQNVVGNSFRLRGPKQSVYTMAATAVMRLIDQYELDPAEIGFLGLGTESSTDNSAGAIIVKGMVDRALKASGRAPLARSCEVPEFKHACLGGVYAMKGALRYLALDGAGSKAVVVCADIAEYARGSTGEPTQGAGAVAMLLERDPALAAIDLGLSGSASDYRVVDFRKPMLRFCGQDRSESHHIQDFPVFNGKYSTTCYIDETLHALDELYTKRGLAPSDYLRSLKHVFMHRPYRRMPENGWAIAWLFALARGNADDRRQIEGYCETAGISFEDLAREMNAAVDVQDFATPDALNNDAYPLTMAVLHAFRGSDRFKPDVLDKLSLGGDAIRDLGNLYTAALPAWLAAGFEEALDSDLSLTGSELLTMGYGSGDAAEVIPFFVGERWRDAANRIHFADAMQGAVDLTCEQYEALHDGRRVSGLEWVPADEFVIERVGQSEERHFQDVGIEYYRYV